MTTSPIPAADDTLERFTVTNGDACLSVLACGHGPRVVLLPSLGRDADDFVPLAQRLAQAGVRALLPSPRGIGHSTGPLDGITLHTLAGDVAAILRHDGGSALVAGHAFGNWVARVTAIDHPALVRGIAVVAAAHKNIAPELRASIDACMDPALPRDERLRHLQATFFAPGHDASEWLAGWHPEVARAQRRASAATPPGWWQAGRVPVLDLQAADDVFAPASGAHLLRDELGADRVRVVRIPQAGHALIPEQPDAVASALIDFLHDLP